MTVLEQVTQMKNQGMPDEEIANQLQQQGASPKEIDDAFSQSQIKSAISDTGAAGMQPPTAQQNPPAPTQDTYAPQIQEMPEQETYAPQTESPQPQEVYQEGAYGDYGAPAGATDTDSIIEIAEQVFAEKIKKIKKQTDDLNEFKTLEETKIDNVSKRLKRIETTIDKLQISILEKVGSYGKNIEGIKKEMGMMQDSFGKVVNQAVRGHKSHIPPTHKTPLHPVKKPATAKKISKKK